MEKFARNATAGNQPSSVTDAAKYSAQNAVYSIYGATAAAMQIPRLSVKPALMIRTRIPGEQERIQKNYKFISFINNPYADSYIKYIIESKSI
jgi:hypothetical protein